jgi:vancomycin permeability regulator SanA
MRLSVKKAAYADLSRVACRKSGVVLGARSYRNQSRRDG